MVWLVWVTVNSLPTLRTVLLVTDTADYGFTYGAGLQFNPIENVALDVGYEQNRIRSVDVGTWNVGVGYRF